MRSFVWLTRSSVSWRLPTTLGSGSACDQARLRPSPAGCGRIVGGRTHPRRCSDGPDPLGGALTVGLWWAGMPAAGEAASKYNACGLLTAAELKAAVNASVDKMDERDVVIPNGPYQGETMSTCTWLPGHHLRHPERHPRPPDRGAEGKRPGRLPAARGRARPEGWTVEPGKVPGRTATPTSRPRAKAERARSCPA